MLVFNPEWAAVSWAFKIRFCYIKKYSEVFALFFLQSPKINSQTKMSHQEFKRSVWEIIILAVKTD